MSLYRKTLFYSLYLIFRPFDGFWDLREEKRGSLAAAFTIVVLAVVTYIAQNQYTGFLFNYTNIKYQNVYIDIASVLLPLFLYCVANWALTSLTDGEGTFKDIFIATSYALTPMIVVVPPLIIITHFMNADEGTFYYVILAISLIWSATLIFFGTMITHDYTLPKTFLTTIGILVGMGVMVFIALLFASVIQQIIGFFYIIYKEIRFRV